MACVGSSIASCCQSDEELARKGEELKPHLIEIRQTEAAAGDDFADLMPLMEVLQGKRIVALGEQSHADGTTFDVKVRLVQFLHEKMGFDVLVLESGFFSNHKAWKGAPFQRDVPVWLASHVIPAWGASLECKPLFEYVAEQRTSANPLQVMGMDCRLHGPANVLMPKDMAKIAELESENPMTENQKKQLVEVARVLLDGTARPEKSVVQAQNATVSAFVRHVKTLKGSTLTEEEQATWLQFARYLADNLEFVWLSVEGMQGNQAKMLKAAELRDQLMARHLLWIADHYRDRKCIVWAATTHLSRGLEKAHSVDSRIPDALFQKSNVRPMGETVHEKLGDAWYAIGFTALEGEVGSALGGVASPLRRPSADSLESLIEKSGYEAAFLDLGRTAKRVPWLGEPQVARPFGYVEVRAPWPEVMDGMIYTKTMRRARPR